MYVPNTNLAKPLILLIYCIKFNVNASPGVIVNAIITNFMEQHVYPMSSQIGINDQVVRQILG